ncbi:MAG: hypothetical protein OXD44_00340 [Gammaproteobacteria bacterium]|nr:hypothetical protein [Gammaproteobacteria bacterium]
MEFPKAVSGFLPERRKVGLAEGFDEVLPGSLNFPAMTRQVLGQSLVETAPNLEVRIVEMVEDVTAPLLLFRNGQIP